MPHDRNQHACVFGLGWGDEGKGKIVDLLCPPFDVVVRFNGGANAGHTVWVGGEKFAVHLLPSGVLHEGITNVIGPGVVVDPITLLQEIDQFTQRGINLDGRVKISDRAHLVLAYHKIEDQLGERAAGEAGKIGTTSRGIGPCYADKMRRSTAVRFSDLIHETDLKSRVRRQVEDRRRMFTAMYSSDGSLSADDVIKDIEVAQKRLGPLICDTTDLLHRRMDEGARIMFEGANGVLLDLDHGTYPFVTSSSTGPHGIGAGAGVPTSRVSRMIGTLKAYSTRVGGGPFVTELTNEIGDCIRKQGNEFGTTTGRPRRCGWFDAVAARHSVRLTGATDVALMHVDTLRGIGDVGVCTAYRSEGETFTTLPAHLPRLKNVEPILEFLPGWSDDLRGARSMEQLPATARRYVERIESLLGVRVSMIGVGPDRAETIIRHDMADFLNTSHALAT